jgi:50S ribosome-binding GTPase/Domain of unknown function (DUF3482)
VSNALKPISLSLVSHTNVGKTTLARTLLGRDIGEVRDEAHVTESAEAQLLIDTPEGDRLLLWDTPGFGDSLRLAQRMKLAGNPLGWLLTEVWDRWRDRAFWSSQRALKHVWEQCDVVLYLVDASQAPQDVGYLDAELQVIALTGKPAVVLLNQLGEPGAAGEAELEARWRERLEGAKAVHAVLPLDAFSRCWVQEGVLWAAVAPLLQAGSDQRAAFERLRAAWRERQLAVWRASMTELSRRLVRAALDVQAVEPSGWRGSVKLIGSRLGQALGWRDGDDKNNDTHAPQQRAMALLAERLDEDLRQSTETLIRLHGLDGRAGREVMARLADHYATRNPVGEGQAALWGGVLTGALAGLKADIASGGLTLGGGLLVGGVLGALGAAGAAHGINLVRGVSLPEVRWDSKVLDALFANALLGYLAVAHHGRGRGAWVAQAAPAAWVNAVEAVVAQRGAAVGAAWERAEGEGGREVIEARVQPAVEQACAQVLGRLYPAAEKLLPVA